MLARRENNKIPIGNLPPGSFGLRSGQTGKVTFFTIVMIIVVLITIIVLAMLISEVMKKEQITLNVRVIDSTKNPVPGAGILINGEYKADADSNGIFRYVYTTDHQGETISITARMANYIDTETSITLTATPETAALILLRPLAELTIAAIDSVSGGPLSGVEVFLGDEKIAETDSGGLLTLPPDRIRLFDYAFIKLKKKNYDTALRDIYVSSLDYSETFALARTKQVARAPRRKPSPTAVTFIQEVAKPLEVTAPPPGEQVDLRLDTTAVPTTSIEEDSAFYYMNSANYRRALDMYSDLTSSRQWTARGDFWLYGADCALHLASDAFGSFNEGTLDSALKFLENAERYQNLVQGDLFPAVVQIKKGEAFAYKSELYANKNLARLEEFRRKALFYLNSGIRQLRNKKLIDNEFFQFAVRMRDEVAAY